MSYTVKTLGPRRCTTFESSILPTPYDKYEYGMSILEEEKQFNYILTSLQINAEIMYGEGSDKYNQALNELISQRNAFLAQTDLNNDTQLGITSNSADFSELAMFKDDAIVSEEAQGLLVADDGTWSESEVEDADAYMKKFTKLENTINMFKRVMSGGMTIQEARDSMTVVNDKNASFDKNGIAIQTKFKCPLCGKEVDLLLKNGYCSKGCAAKARIAKALSKIGDGGLRVIDMINKVKDYLSLLDMVLNIISELPEMIKGMVKLPQEYRDYVMLRIDCMFLEIKRMINIILIAKNDYLIQIVKKLKLGTLDDKLKVIFAPIQAILTTIIAVQQALNIALAAVLKLLDVPMTGIGPLSYGWLMTAKSMQYAETSGKLFIEIVPKMDLPLPLKTRMNNINQQLIDKITQVSLPPIQDFEYLMPPEAFKIRYALSQDNTPRLKKMQEMMEALMVMGCDTFPRWKRLSLINVWFVLSILTGWGPLSRGVYGDFIFHGAM